MNAIRVSGQVDPNQGIIRAFDLIYFQYLASLMHLPTILTGRTERISRSKQ